ncbi:MAG: TRAP transporter large permease subunit [Treponemataceae bacterium]|nr:MAG: TRAP transporter large permease subunit [Treponemataceae bacterium]
MQVFNLLGVVFVFLLALAPLLLTLIQSGFGVLIARADLITANILFVFSCIAGFKTWETGRHISLAAITEKLSEKANRRINIFKASLVSAILTAIAFAALSQMFTAFVPGEKIFGIPRIAIFAVLPLVFFGMIIFSIFANPAAGEDSPPNPISKRTNGIAVGIGIVLGLVIASGPIFGVIYSMTGGNVTIDFLNTLFYAWCDAALHYRKLIIVLLILCAFIGIPMFIVMGAISYLLFSGEGGNVELISLEAYQILTDKSIAAIPLFTITGFLLSKGSAGKRLVDVFKSFLGSFKGGSIIAAVLVAAFFTTFTGVSGVTILALGSILTIILTGQGYSEKNAHSLITASGSIGLLFPPSAAIIMYGSLNYFSIDVMKLFEGAVVPGTLLCLSMIVLAYIKNPNLSAQKFDVKTAFASLRDSIYEILLPVFICILYFSGVFDLVESAAFSVVYTILLETVVRKDFTLKSLYAALLESLPISGGILFILAMSRGISYFFDYARIPDLLTQAVVGHIHSKYLFLLALNVLLLIAGCLMDIYSAILIISPLIIPIAEAFGISGVHLGVVFLMNLQIGFLTPPMGMDLFIASYAFNTPVPKIIRGILPYLAVQLLVLLIVTYVPIFPFFY